MKTRLLLICILIFFQNIFAQEIIGTWKGDLEINGMKLPLIIHIQKDKEGYISTLDSPNQNAYGISTDQTTYYNKKLDFEVSRLHLKYSGILKDRLISGTFQQGTFQTPLDMKPLEGDVKRSVTVKTLPQNLDKNLQKVEDFLTYLEKMNYNAGELSIFRDGNEIYHRTFGEKNLPDFSSEDHLLQIGSITKTFTSVMLNQLVQEGKLSFSEKLSKYFPEVPNANKITLTQMLNHTSGLADYVKKGDDYYWLTVPATENQILDNIKSQKPLFKPGASSSYSNSAYYLLTKILEKTTHKSYDENLRERILSPLKLNNVFSVNQNPKGVYKSYDFEGKWILTRDFDFHNVIGVGDIAASPKDLNTFINALFAGQLVSKNTLESMLPQKGEKFGLGLAKIPFYNKEFLGHSGGTYGTNSLMIYNPGDKISIAYSLNASRIESPQFMVGIMSLLYGIDYEYPKINETKLSEDQLKPYEGDYTSTQISLGMKIFSVDGQLFCQASGQQSFPLQLVEVNTFKFDSAGVQITFIPKENQMILKQNGMEFTFTKNK